MLDRCSLLEPGPVGTAIVGNIDAWTKKYDKPTADPKSQETFGNVGGKLLQGFHGTVQDVNEVAEIVKNIILSEKPNLRFQTNDKYYPDQVKAKLVDPTGNNLVEMLYKKFFQE